MRTSHTLDSIATQPKAERFSLDRWPGLHRQSAKAPKRQSAKAPKRQSAKAPKRQSAKAPKRQSAAQLMGTIASNNCWCDDGPWRWGKAPIDPTSNPNNFQPTIKKPPFGPAPYNDFCVACCNNQATWNFSLRPPCWNKRGRQILKIEWCLQRAF